MTKVKYPKLSKASAITRTIILGTLVTGAQAQSQEVVSQAKKRSSLLEEVVVTAMRRESKMEDTPITMSAYSGDQMKSLGVVDTRDMEKLVPGFKYADSGFNVPIFTLRGVGFNEFSQTASGTVGLYVDEFNLPFPIMAKGPNVDLARTEVLKGPQGTLYGRNTTAGAINYISNKPGDEFEAGFSRSYGRFETTDTEAYVSTPITDTFGVRFAVRDIQSGEGWQKSLTRPNGPDGELGKFDKAAARFVAVWDATDALSINFSVDAWRDRSDAQAGQPIKVFVSNPIVGPIPGIGQATLTPTVANHPVVPFNTNDMRVAEWTPQTEGEPKWRFNDSFYDAKLRADYQRLDNMSIGYLGSIGKFKSDKSGVPIAALSVHTVNGVFDVETKFWNQELRLSGDINSEVNYTVGVFISRDTVDDNWDVFFGQSSLVFPHDLNGKSLIADRGNSIAFQEAETEAFFFNVEWQFLPYLGFSVGARYTNEKRDFEGCVADSLDDSTGSPHFNDLLNAISIANGGTGGAGRGECVTLDTETRNPGLVVKSLEEDNISGRTSLNWTPNDETLVYLSFSRGFKSGSFPRLQASEEEQYRPVTQERLDAYEVGGKFSLLERALQLNAAAFYYDYRDKQLLGNLADPVFGVLPQLVNAPKSEVRGAEIEIKANPFEGLDLLVSAAYVDTEVIKLVSLNTNGEFEDFSGNEFNYTPNLTGTISANYSWFPSFFNNWVIAVGADYSYTGETNSVLSEEPDFDLRDYSNVDMRFSVGAIDQVWKVTFWGRNITNEYKPVSVTQVSGGDSVVRYVQMPQTYGVSISLQY